MLLCIVRVFKLRDLFVGVFLGDGAPVQFAACAPHDWDGQDTGNLSWGGNFALFGSLENYVTCLLINGREG